MTQRPPSRRRLKTLCGELGPGDGLDPKLADRPGRSSAKPDHKARRLCGQVAETLDAVLAGDAAEPACRDLRIVAIDPAPDASRLLVTVAPRQPSPADDPREILAALDRASGWLRSMVASAITRRRAPTLAFRVVVVTEEPI